VLKSQPFKTQKMKYNLDDNYEEKRNTRTSSDLNCSLRWNTL